VTTVFFLFLVHLSLGLMAMLPLVPDRAGVGFFKLCSASAATMTTAGLWLLVRRFGWDGGLAAPGGGAYEVLLFLCAAFLTLTVVYNRAWHLGWVRIRRPLLLLSLLAGLAAVLLAIPPRARMLVAAADLTSVMLLGAAASAMVLGHYYLVVLDLPISALRRLTVLLIAFLLLRSVVVVVALVAGDMGAYQDLHAVASGLWSPDGVFVWMRLLFGLAGPLSLAWFIWKTVEIRSTQSATGILYVQLFFVLSGELLAKYLRVAAGFAL
jgi:protein NrfD